MTRHPLSVEHSQNLVKKDLQPKKRRKERTSRKCVEGATLSDYMPLKLAPPGLINKQAGQEGKKKKVGQVDGHG